MEVPVRCVVSHLYEEFTVDLAAPLCTLPEGLTQGSSSGASKRNKARLAFRLALKTAMEMHLACEVRPFTNDRVEWGDGDGK